MLRPAALSAGHYECRSFKETLPVLKDFLAFEVVSEKSDTITVKHANTGWLLVVHENPGGAPDKPRFNHYGVRVATDQEIENAYEHLQSKKKQYGLKVDKVRDNHHAHSVHFTEPGGNWWEIESYEKAVESGLGKTAAPHWKSLLTEDRFPGRGYVPQAFTHGTVQCENIQETRRFYQEALGLEVVQLWPNSIYVKHAASPWYIVHLQAPPGAERTYLGQLQRFTLDVNSSAAVYAALEELSQQAKDFGLTTVEKVREDLLGPSFLLCDLNRNWWEITARSASLDTRRA
jgi:catechol 2,3-dioxygenase-like lactoylglutathione lyase family enzyme